MFKSLLTHLSPQNLSTLALRCLDLNWYTFDTVHPLWSLKQTMALLSAYQFENVGNTIFSPLKLRNDILEYCMYIQVTIISQNKNYCTDIHVKLCLFSL